MQGETNLDVLLRSLKPGLNEGDFVFCVVGDYSALQVNDVIMQFKEKEGTTIIMKKELADRLQLSYSFVAAWITLTVHSSLEAVGLTAAFSSALANAGISCNVVAAFYHDHIFVDKKDTDRAMEVLNELQNS
jgi:uncharacterized protein